MGFWKDVSYEMSLGKSKETAIKVTVDYYKKYKRLGVLIKGDFLELDSGELVPDFLVIGTPRIFEERKF